MWLLVRQGNDDRRSRRCTHSSSLLPSAFSIPLCPSPWTINVMLETLTVFGVALVPFPARRCRLC